LRRTYPELVEAIRDEEMRLGCPMTVGEIDAFARGYHAEEYRLDLRKPGSPQDHEMGSR
jgi:hypothetical protein